MIDLKDFRIVDLSKEMRPGVAKANGEYMHGGESRRLEIRQFVYEPDKMVMYWVDTESHIGTHVEGPAHYPGVDRDLTDLPLDTFIGEATVLDFSELSPLDGKSRPIRPEHLKEVRSGDIVLMWSPYEGSQSPYITPEASAHLLEVRVKMVGIQGIGLEAPGSMASHETFLLNDIPIIEGLVNLDQISKKRVFYVGLPIRIKAVDSTWVRAIALEAK